MTIYRLLKKSMKSFKAMSKLIRISKEDLFWAQGRALNFLAVGDTVKHPPPNTPPNVAFVDISIQKDFLPRSYTRYLPNVNLDKNDQLNVLGMVTLRDIEDNEELFVDYWDVYLYDKEKAPDWLVVPPPALNHYYTKKHYEHKIPLLLELAKQSFLPEAVLSRHDLQAMIDTKIEQLLLPAMRSEKISLPSENQNVPIAGDSEVKLNSDKKSLK
jgi:hypothetical protein